MHAFRFPSLTSWFTALIMLAWCVGGLPPVQSVASAQQNDSEAEEDPLISRQTSVAARYARLEELLLRLSDAEARENPERAALLKRVARQSRERFVLEKLRGASELIAKGQLSSAVDDQKSATSELEGLLKLLLSEDRSSRIRDEKKRIAEIIKQLRLTERDERSVRARTENGVEFDEVLKEQEEISKRAQRLHQELQDEQETAPEAETAPEEQAKSSPAENETDSPETEGSQSPMNDDDETDRDDEKKDSQASESESNPSEKQGEGEQSEGKESQNESSKGEKSEGEKSESNQTESEKSADEKADENPEGNPTESQKSEGKQSQGQQSEQSGSSQPQQPQSPEQQAQSQLQKALERMQQAQEKLAEEKRGEASAEQRLAEEELRKAIDKLEKILRQLREEEIQRELAQLEARLRKMAAMQSAVLDETVLLAKTPQSQRDRTTDLKAGDLSFEEQKITLQADRAMLLLREEGSSVAFPEVILQLRDDTRRVATRLGQSKIDVVTQGIQNDILVALEEMIAALAKAQRDNEKKQQNQQQGQPSGEGSQEQPLVQALAELKLLRTMQTRIQKTTDRYGNLIDADNNETEVHAGEEILPLLRDLAQRQDRLYQITRDLVTKRNR